MRKRLPPLNPLRAFEATADYVQNYVQGGRILIKHQAVALRLADMATISQALAVFSTDVGSSVGSSSVIYLSIPDPAATSTAIRRRADPKTSSIIGAVRRPVFVFCRLGW